MARSVAMTEGNPGVDTEPSRSMVRTAVAVAAGWLIIDVLIGYTAEGPLAALLGLGGFVLAIAALWNLAAVARARRPHVEPGGGRAGPAAAAPGLRRRGRPLPRAAGRGVRLLRRRRVAAHRSGGGLAIGWWRRSARGLGTGVRPSGGAYSLVLAVEQPSLIHGYPLRRRNRQRVAVAAYLARVDAGFLAAAIAHYLAHPEQRSGIGTPRGARRAARGARRH